jgi:hypothetical protein
MEQMEPKEGQLPETEEETRVEVPEQEGILLGSDDFPPPEEEPCPCPCDEE